MYPPLESIPRKSRKSYPIPGTKLVIPAETLVLVSVSALHKDPQIYANPQVFDPERFNSENKKLRHPMAYIPFGN